MYATPSCAEFTYMHPSKILFLYRLAKIFSLENRDVPAFTNFPVIKIENFLPQEYAHKFSARTVLKEKNTCKRNLH